MTLQQTVQIISNTTVSEGYFKIRVACGFNYKDSVPGQFVTLRLPGRTEPLLRRPFSINRLMAGVNNENLQMDILYRVVGGFTLQLSEMEPGDSIDMLGPVGRGFTVKRHSRKVALAAGGIGVAPLVFLAERLRQAGTDMDLVTVFLGGRTKTDILCKDIFADLGADIRVATEDGSAGQQGLVTDPMQAWMDESIPAMVYACGPDPMLKAVGEMAESRDIYCEVSIETLMACGLGVCMGCAVHTKDSGEGYRHACKHGPVFDSRILA